jgi:hypothetical protein
MENQEEGRLVKIIRARGARVIVYLPRCCEEVVCDILNDGRTVTLEERQLLPLAFALLRARKAIRMKRKR